MPASGDSTTGVRRVRRTPSVTRHPAASPQQSLALELPATPTTRHTPARAKRLWLCLYLPALPLDALGHSDADTPRAVFEDQDGMRRVLLASPAAEAAGIAAGMTVNAALALLPTLTLERRDPGREATALRTLAGWAEQYTSLVALEAPAVLLLELAGSLRLFGGLEALRRGIVRGLDDRGFAVSPAIAPTPLAATWLARSRRRVCIEDPAGLTGALSRLPLESTGWSTDTCDALYGMGISRVGDCLRLPRQGFAKRFGTARLLALDRAVGRLPDPRIGYRTPERFVRDLDLTEELGDREQILEVCRDLLESLGGFLLTRQLPVQHVLFSFFHLQHPATHLPLGCVRPERDADRWFELLSIRFERLEIPAPAIAVRLRGGQGQPEAAMTDGLPFKRRGDAPQHWPIEYLVERLGARMGEGTVHGLCAVAEHRPHYAWRREPALERLPSCQALPGFWYERHAPELLADFRKTDSLLLRRPLWMLSEPRPLETRDGQPLYQGLLQMTDGPERLETGWWDTNGIARDYYVAVNPDGVHLWIYRERGKPGDWYLHGIFG